VKRKYRITRAIDFKRVRQSGKRFSHPLVVIVVANGIEGQKRFGIVTNKTVGNAVTRNLIKRRLRTSLSLLVQKMNKDVDILVYARKPISTATYQAIDQAVKDVFMKAEIILE
jgi:ribonuclease P protein component